MQALRQAGESIRRCGGRLDLEDGGLVVVVPTYDQFVLDAAKLLYAGEPIVVDHVRRKAPGPAAWRSRLTGSNQSAARSERSIR